MSVAGKKVLVTGADGFIGSHLVERLVADGADVRAFCLYNPQGSWGWLDSASDHVRTAIDVRLGDIRDAAFVADATAGVEIVFHLAALIAIPYSYERPSRSSTTNIQGTLNVLEAARRHGRDARDRDRRRARSTARRRRCRFARPIRSTRSRRTRRRRSRPISSRCRIHRSFGSPVVVLRPFNTYGPRQSTRAVLPTILAQLLARRDARSSSAGSIPAAI